MIKTENRIVSKSLTRLKEDLIKNKVIKKSRTHKNLRLNLKNFDDNQTDPKEYSIGSPIENGLFYKDFTQGFDLYDKNSTPQH